MIDFALQILLLAAIENMQKMYCVSTDSETDIATAQTQERHKMISLAMSRSVTKTVVDQSLAKSSACIWLLFVNFLSKITFCNGITVKKKERRIFGIEIFIFVRVVNRSVYTVYGRYFKNLPNFEI